MIGLIIGAALGSLIVLWDTQYAAKQIKRGHAQKPEDRLRTALFGGPALAAAMFWFAWSAEYNSVHWIVPTIAGVFLAAAMLCIFVSFLNYLVDTYLMFAASAIAANTVARSAAGSAAPLFTDQMFTALGVGGGGSLVGGVAALLALIPFCFFKYGEGIRIRSRFAPTGPPAGKQQPHDETDAAEKGHGGGGGSMTGEGESSDTVPTTVRARNDSLMDEASDKEDGHERRGDRESMDENPFEYATDVATPSRHRHEDVQSKAGR